MMGGGFGFGMPDKDYNVNSSDNSRVEKDTDITSLNLPSNSNYQFPEDEMPDHEIDFDKLLGDAIIAEAEYDEDREDQFEDDDDDGAADKGPKNFAEDSLAFSMSMPNVQKPAEPKPSA